MNLANKNQHLETGMANYCIFWQKFFKTRPKLNNGALRDLFHCYFEYFGKNLNIEGVISCAKLSVIFLRWYQFGRKFPLWFLTFPEFLWLPNLFLAQLWALPVRNLHNCSKIGLRVSFVHTASIWPIFQRNWSAQCTGLFCSV